MPTERKYQVEWEELTHNRGTYLSRAKVPGGWLVREEQDVISLHPGTQTFQSGSITFIPDPNHVWLFTQFYFEPHEYNKWPIIHPEELSDEVKQQMASINA